MNIIDKIMSIFVVGIFLIPMAFLGAGTYASFEMGDTFGAVAFGLLTMGWIPIIAMVIAMMRD